MEEAYSKHTHRHKKKNTERHTQTHTHKHTHTHTQTQTHKTCRKHTTKSGFGLGTSFSATPCSATWILTSVFFSVFFRCSSFFLSLWHRRVCDTVCTLCIFFVCIFFFSLSDIGVSVRRVCDTVCTLCIFGFLFVGFTFLDVARSLSFSHGNSVKRDLLRVGLFWLIYLVFFSRCCASSLSCSHSCAQSTLCSARPRPRCHAGYTHKQE